jgi:3-oxoacyl-[acyl-carrier-protein] synthase-3
MQHFEIVGSGLYLPQVVLSAEDIDRRLGVAEGWTRTHVGVSSRHECVAPESLGSMAKHAATAALADASITWSEVDLILDASTSRHRPIPCNAAHLQAHFGDAAQGIPCFDIQATCLGFMLAVHVANGLFATRSYRHVLIVCSEGGLAGVNWNEPESAALLGDGAAAVVLRAGNPQPTYHFAHETHAQHLDVCQVRGGAHELPPFAYRPENDADYRFHMDGPRVFRVACKYLPPMVEALLQRSGIAREHLQVLPHQASPRAVEAMRRFLGFPMERYHNRVERFGNLVSASIPALLHQCRREQIIGTGDRVLLLGTSAGYSQAAMIFRM